MSTRAQQLSDFFIVQQHADWRGESEGGKRWRSFARRADVLQESQQVALACSSSEPFFVQDRRGIVRKRAA